MLGRCVRGHWKKENRRSLAFWNMDLSSTGFSRKLNRTQGCVCRKFILGSSIPQNSTGRKTDKVIKLNNNMTIEDQSSRGDLSSCIEYTSKLSTRRTKKRNYSSTFFSLWSRVGPGSVYDLALPGVHMLQNRYIVSRRCLK